MTELTDKYWERLHFLNNETDRSIVIVAGALLDEALKELLKAKLLPSQKKERCVLTGSNSPIGSFSARIDLCYQLGLISKLLQRDLHIIRKLRNDFAHNPFDLSFNSSSVKSRIKELDVVSNDKERILEDRKNCGPPGIKHDFIFLVSWLLHSVTEPINDIKPFKECVPEFNYLDLKELKKISEKQGIFNK